LYAQAYPQAVVNLVLRGIFTARPSETNWSRGGIGAAYLYPDAYDQFLSHLPASQRNDPICSYYQLLTLNDFLARRDAARSWNKWDMTIGALAPDVSAYDKINNDDRSLSHARLEAHYIVHGAWLEQDQVLNLENLTKITHIPCK
jgi:proline iminopeptidase